MFGRGGQEKENARQWSNDLAVPAIIKGMKGGVQRHEEREREKEWVLINMALRRFALPLSFTYSLSLSTPTAHTLNTSLPNKQQGKDDSKQRIKPQKHMEIQHQVLLCAVQFDVLQGAWNKSLWCWGLLHMYAVDRQCNPGTIMSGNMQHNGGFRNYQIKRYGFRLILRSTFVLSGC